MVLEYRPTILPAAAVVAVTEEPGAVIVVDEAARWHRVILKQGTLRLESAPSVRKPQRRPGMLDDGVVSTGTRNIRAA
jgi:hypothetical protein